jgi:hypothetical protein
MIVRRGASHLLLTIAIAAAAIHDAGVSGQDVSPASIPPNEECSFRDCCQDDCCGSNTSWSTTYGKCIRDPGSTGFDDTYSPEYEFGCIQRGCCESDCCADGTQYDETIISCMSCPEECIENEGETFTDMLPLPTVFGVGPAGRSLQAATTEDAGTGISRRLGLCIRTPFGPGKITLMGCNAANLNNMAILPEIGVNTIFPPVNNKEYDADGIYFRGNAPMWYKIPDHCSATMTCLPSGKLKTEICCNVCASICFGKPRTVNGGHGAKAPPGF